MEPPSPRPRRVVFIALVSLVAAALASCSDRLEYRNAVTAGVSYCDPVADWPDDHVAFERRVFELVNEVRVVGAHCDGEYYPPTQPLVSDAALNCASRAHSKDMGDNGYFDHTSLDGSSPNQRAGFASYDGRSGWENIASGQGSAAGVVRAWMQSPGHCRNIMDDGHVDMGVGYYATSRRWTLLFGR